MTRRPSVCLIGAVLAAGTAISSSRMAAIGQAPGGISPAALAQMDALIREKDTRTPAERKIDSQLLYAMRMAQGLPAAPGVQRLDVDIPRADDGHVIVDVRANATAALRAHVSAITAEAKPIAGGTMQLHLAMDQIADLASDPDVAFIQPRQRYDLAGAGSGVGNVTAQSDIKHRAAVFRGLSGATGAGLKIGVLSDGVNGLAVSQATGDLGPVTLVGTTTNGSEGTAMLELIHDLAPGAQLYFASAIGSMAEFAQNIRTLRALGCDIIVDDVRYFVETPFQDGQTGATNTNGGIVIQAVKDVTASGALYFSSAGNSGNVNDGTSGAWEGDFVDGGTPPPFPAGTLHAFTGSQAYDIVTKPGILANLYWSDPLGGSANDYDLFRLDPAGSLVLSSSTNVQNGTQDPYEELSQVSPGDRLVVLKKAGALPRFLHLDVNRGTLSVATQGSIHGHAATNSPGAFGVAATNAGGTSLSQTPFSTSDVVETFSSDGPRRIFFDGTGAALTPGNVSSSGGVVLQKPDITAADGVLVNGSGGFPSPFFGTSAAAPNAAAIAALIKSANPGFTTADVRSALTASAVDIETPGVDRDSGAGIVMAQAPQPGCSMTMTGGTPAAAGGGSGSVNIAASAPTCNWAVWSNVSWITIPVAAGTGSATVAYSVAANPGPSRAATLFVDGGSSNAIAQSANPRAPLTLTSSGAVPLPESATTNATLSVSGLTAALSHVTVSLGITHSFDAVFRISLIAPDGTSVPLITSRGDGANFGTSCGSAVTQTRFDDSAQAHIGQGSPPYVGPTNGFRSEGLLSQFRGKKAAALNGTWTLRVQNDGFGFGAGTLNCWSLNIWTDPSLGVARAVNDVDGDLKSDAAIFRKSGDWAFLTSSSNFVSPLIRHWGGAGDTPVAGDYDGDGAVDLALYRETTGDWLVLTSSSGFTTSFTVNWGGPGFKPMPGDYDGDGRFDPALYNPRTATWSILRSSASYGTTISAVWGGPGYTPVPGQDLDGDGKADLTLYRQSAGTWTALTSSTNFSTILNVPVVLIGGSGDYMLVPGDYDGDGRTDIGRYDRETGDWRVLFAATSYFTGVSRNWGGRGYIPVPADFDGDFRVDMALFQPSTGNWYVLKSSSGFTLSMTIAGSGATDDPPLTSAVDVGATDTVRASDFDGDVTSEMTVYNAANGVWSILDSAGGYTTATSASVGGSGYDPYPGDFDLDGKTDLALYQQSTGSWYVLLSSANFTSSLTKGAGGPGWAAVPADYDGDNKTDFAVYNTTTGVWYVLKSSTNYTTSLNISWGGTGYTAQPADFDGDGRADLAVYRSTGDWYVLLSSTNYTTTLGKNVGGAGYIPVAADYDGDGKADFAVYDVTAGLWYALKSNAGFTTSLSIYWGGAGYAPVKGDFDGDGRTDLALYQQSTGYWYVLLSSGNYTTTVVRNWGGPGYLPVRTYFD